MAKLTPFADTTSKLTMSAVNEHYNTILRHAIKRVGASREAALSPAEAVVIVSPLRGDSLKLKDAANELLDQCHSEVISSKCSLASTLSQMVLFACGHTQQSVAHILEIGASDAVTSSMRSLFEGLGTVEVEKLLAMYLGKVEATKNTALSNLRSLILRHCKCEKEAAMTTPAEIARASVHDVNNVLKAMGKQEESVDVDLVLKIVWLNTNIHSRSRATPASVADMQCVLVVTKKLATDKALEAMTLSADDVSAVRDFVDKVDESITGLKDSLAAAKKPSKHSNLYADVEESMQSHPVPESWEESTAWVEFMRDGGGAAIVSGLDKLKTEAFV